MNFENDLKIKISSIDYHLDKYLKKNGLIYKAMGYSIFAGGKRLRPLLLLSAVETVSQDSEKYMPFACALEMIHTYSLIHDDLPAMDNDDFRRGKPTNHKVYGEAMAILAGDGLLNLAFEIMLESSITLNNPNSLLAMKKIANCSGVNGMIGGQELDILSENKKIDNETLLNIHNKKTGALFQCSLVAGALLGNANKDLIEKFDEIGLKIGLAFQIKDDILDICSDEITLGKPILSDEKNNKTTYVTIHGLEKSKNDYDILCMEILTLLKSIDNPFLLNLVNKLINRVC